MDKYWTGLVQQASKISKENGMPEYDDTFWAKQSAGVVYLLVKINTKYFNLKYSTLENEND